MRIIKCNNSSFDYHKACYDLSLIYAKAKLDESMWRDPDATKDRTSFVLEEFCHAMGYFTNLSEEYIKELVDH